MGKQGNETETIEDNSLTDFNWDEGGEHNFFGIEQEAPKDTKQKDLLNEVKKADVPAKKTEAKKEDKEDQDEDKEDEDSHQPFSEEEAKPKKVKDKVEVTDEDQDDDKTEDDLDDEQGTDDEDEDIKFYTELASELKEKGVFSNIEIKKGEDIDEEKFFELHEQEVDSRVEETFKGFFDELNQDKDAIDLIKFVKNGGKSEDFFKVYTQSPVLEIEEGIDLSKIANQKKVCRVYLRTIEGLDEDEVNERIEFYEEKGKLEENSEKYNNKIIGIDKKNKERLLKDQEAAKETARKSSETLRNTLQSTLNETDAVGMIKFTAEDKKNLVQAITKPSVKVGDNRYTTSFQSKMAAIMKDPKKLLVLAKIIEDDFNFKDLATTAETTVTKRVKSVLADAKKTKVLKGSSDGKQRSLADFFPEDKT